MLCIIGGGITEAAMGEGVLHRGSSWPESGRSIRLLEDALEKRDLLPNMLEQFTCD